MKLWYLTLQIIGSVLGLAGACIFYSSLIGPAGIHQAYFGGDTGQLRHVECFLGWPYSERVTSTAVSREYARLAGSLPPEQHWLFLGESGSDPFGGHYCGLGKYDHLYEVEWHVNRILPALTDKQRLAFIREVLARARQPDHREAVGQYLLTREMALP
jgi:hypothetical protein